MLLCGARCTAGVGSSRKIEYVRKILKVSAKFECLLSTFCTKFEELFQTGSKVAKRLCVSCCISDFDIIGLYFFTICIRLSDGVHTVGTGLGYGLDNGEIMFRFSPNSRGFFFLPDA